MSAALAAVLASARLALTRSASWRFISSLPLLITKVPLPWMFCTMPSSASSLYALVTVSTDTRSSLASLRRDGSASPEARSPDSTAALI